jgi:hypothetical protein
MVPGWARANLVVFDLNRVLNGVMSFFFGGGDGFVDEKESFAGKRFFGSFLGRGTAFLLRFHSVHCLFYRI